MEKIRLKLKAYDHRVIDRSIESIVEAVKKFGLNINLKSYSSIRYLSIMKDILVTNIVINPSKRRYYGIYSWKNRYE